MKDWVYEYVIELNGYKADLVEAYYTDYIFMDFEEDE